MRIFLPNAAALLSQTPGGEGSAGEQDLYLDMIRVGEARCAGGASSERSIETLPAGNRLPGDGGSSQAATLLTRWSPCETRTLR